MDSPIMHENNDDSQQHRKKYAIITPSVRMAFIKKVLSKQATIKEAAKEYGIKFSTSKAILQTYRREGRVGKKKTRTRKSIHQMDIKQEPINNYQQQPVVSDGQKQIQNTQQSTLNQLQQPIKVEQTSSFQQLQLQQQQLLQMSMMMNPYSMMFNQSPQPNMLDYYKQELDKQKAINQQLWQMIELTNQNKQNPQNSIRDFGHVYEPGTYITPLQSAQQLENMAKQTDNRSTMRDFN